MLNGHKLGKLACLRITAERKERRARVHKTGEATEREREITDRGDEDEE